MPIHKIERNITGINDGVIRLWLDSVISVDITIAETRQTLVGPPRDDPIQIAAKATALLQDRLDVHIPLTDLPNGVATGDVAENIDPDRFTDPARPNLFWQNVDGITYLIGRSIVATVEWTGKTYSIRVMAV